MSENNSLRAAVEAFRAGDLRTADRLGREAVASQPGNVEALHLLSLVAQASGDRTMQAEYLKRTLSVAPNHVPSLNALANLLREQGRLHEASECARRAIQAGPRFAPAYNTLGLCQEQLGLYGEAVQSFKGAIDLQPEVAAIHVNLGAALQRLDQNAQAFLAYQTAAKLAPNLAAAYEGMGHASVRLRKRRKALEFFSRALELNPNSVQLMLLVAQSQAQFGHVQQSLGLIERALAVDPNLAKGHLEYGFRMQELGDFEAARKAFLESARLQPIQGEAFLALATIDRVRPTDRTLIDHMQVLLESPGLSDSDRVLLHTALGKANDDLGEFGQAIGHIEEANRIELANTSTTLLFDRKGFAAYVDAVVALFTPQFIADRADWASASDLPVLIVGLPRSGTTLTEQIVSAHPQVIAAGEQPYWSDVNAEHDVLELFLDKRWSQEVARGYVQVLRSIGPNARFVTDKMPDNFLYVGLIHILFPNAKFIYCRRNLLDNCLSLYMTPFRKRSPFAHTREDIVFYVQQVQRLMEHWTQVLPKDRVLEVDYEHTVRESETAARRIIAWLGLEWDDACLRPERNTRAVSTPSNWQTRQPVYTTSIERWRAYEPWLGAFETLAPPDSVRPVPSQLQGQTDRS